MRKLFWFLVVVLVLALAADRGGALFAERVAATQLKDEQDLPQKPDVSIAGFPFLDQFAKGEYDEVTLRAASLPVKGADLTLRSVRLDFTDVTTNRDFSSFSAARARATATIGYADLGRQLDLDASYAGDGRVTVSKTFDALGGSFDAKATVDATYERGSLTLGDFELGDNLPSAIGDRLRGAVDNAVKLDDLPFDVTVQSVRATTSGLRLTLRGKDLSYTS